MGCVDEARSMSFCVRSTHSWDAVPRGHRPHRNLVPVECLLPFVPANPEKESGSARLPERGLKRPQICQAQRIGVVFLCGFFWWGWEVGIRLTYGFGNGCDNHEAPPGQGMLWGHILDCIALLRSGVGLRRVADWAARDGGSPGEDEHRTLQNLAELFLQIVFPVSYPGRRRRLEWRPDQRPDCGRLPGKRCPWLCRCTVSGSRDTGW